MVDSLNNNSLTSNTNSLIRAQAVSNTAKASAPTIVASKQQPAATKSSKNVTQQEPIKFAGASGNLPRGSLVDITV